MQGRYNYRAADVRASVYLVEVVDRHLLWRERQDISPEPGIQHIKQAQPLAR
jgi:TolB-like protein